MENYPAQPGGLPIGRSFTDPVTSSNKFWQFLASVRARPSLWRAVNTAARLSYLGATYSIPAALISYAKKHSGRSSLAYELMARFRKRQLPVNRKRKGTYPIVLNPPAKRRRMNPGAPSGGPITTQRDVKVTRGRKRLSRGQKRWKRFVKKVNKATDANEKTHFLMEANNAYATITGTMAFDVQDVMTTSTSGDDYNLLLSSVGNIATGPCLFINNLRQQKPTTGTASTAVATDFNNLKYKLLGASCTVSFLTKSTASMFVDIYECVAASDITNANYGTAQLAWDSCLDNNTELDQLGVRASLVYTFTGCTPYQAPGFNKWWKIIKKTRIICPASSKTNYTYYTKAKYINNAKTIGQYATKGLTKDLIIVANPTFHGDVLAATQL